MNKLTEGLREREFIEEIVKNGGDQTRRHIRNVANYMKMFADVLGEDSDIWFHAGLLHDAGKCFVDPEILGKTSKLTDEEYEKVKHHVSDGVGLIASMKIPAAYKAAAEQCCKYHHLWYRGGKGYSADKMLSRTAIPLIARACAIVDVFDAITAKRSYSGATPVIKTVEIMNGLLREGQFDPLLYKTFIEKVVGLQYTATAVAA